MKRTFMVVLAVLFYVLAALLVAHIFVSYFVSLPALWTMMHQSPGEHPEAFGWMVAVTVLFYANFAHFREQLCVVVCPYGRLQSVLLDADSLIIGGGMCFTFLAAQGHSIGNSLFEADFVDTCKALLDEHGDRLHLPSDIVGLGPGGKLFDPEAGGEVRNFGADLPDGWMGVDIGPGAAAEFGDIIGEAGTILWNGPMGVFEDPRFEAGTKVVAEAVAETRGFTVIGGGDSAAAIAQFGLASQVDHVSTGGGASLELIEQGDLPGLQALREASHG